VNSGINIAEVAIASFSFFGKTGRERIRIAKVANQPFQFVKNGEYPNTINGHFPAWRSLGETTVGAERH
jgi:hypothetical protein